MADLGPSVADIAQARNQKIQQETESKQQVDQVAQELQDAHLAAQHIKDTLPSEQDVEKTQLFPHGPATSTPHREGPTMSEKIQHAQADLYSNIKDKASEVGEAIKGNIANTDQSTTTALRDATAAATSKVNEASSTVAGQAGGLLEKAKEAVKGALGMSGESGPGATGYEGAVFSSDDPEYKSGNKATGGGVDGSSFPQRPVAVEVGNSTEQVTQELEAGQPATDQVMDKKHGGTAEAPAGVTEFRTPPLTLGELNSDANKARPTIASPKEEPGSARESDVGVAAGDPAGGANVVAAARSAGKGIFSTVSDALGLSARSPAGPPPDTPDPRTADVAVGDFKGLKEALAAIRDTTPSASGTAGTPPTSSPDAADIPAADVAATDSGGSTDAAEGVDAGKLKEGYDDLKGRAQESLSGAADKARETAESAMQSVSETTGTTASDSSSAGGTATTGGAGGGILAGLASLVSDIAAKANIASSSEELLAGGVVPDDAASPAAAGGDIAQPPAPEAAAAAGAASDSAAAARDAATGGSGGSGGSSMGDTMSNAAQAAKDAASGAAAAVKDGAQAAKDAAADTAGEVQERAQGVTERVRSAAAGAAAAVVHAMEVEGMGASGVGFSGSKLCGSGAAAAGGGDRTAGATAAGEAAATGQDKGTGESLVQGAKEGFVGAYDTAAGAAASTTDAVKDAASRLTGSSSDQQQQTGAGQQQQQAEEQRGGGFGQGSGSSSSPSGGGYAGGATSLKQAWEDLKHGGSKAPHATSIAGETAAPHDVTSNVERSKHLHDPQEAKVYDAEVYRVSPGRQAAGGASTEQDKARAAAGAVAGDKRSVTGTTPHDKPDTYKVHPDQTNRFAGDKGIGTGFGTGSAAPWTDDSVKKASSLFVNSGSGASAFECAPPASVYSMDSSSSLALPAAMSAGEQQALVDAAHAAAASVASAERAGSSSEAAVRSWVSGMSAVWANMGRAAAKGPTPKDLPKDFFDNPNQDVVIDPIRGPVKYDSDTPGHKVQMRTAGHVTSGGSAVDPVRHEAGRLNEGSSENKEGTGLPMGGNALDPNLASHKAERFIKVVSDTLTTSSDQAAADPDNLKGKSSDNKPDGVEHFLKHEAAEVGRSIADAPQKAASALGTAAEIGGGVLGHIRDKVGEVAGNIAGHRDIRNQQQYDENMKASVQRVDPASSGPAADAAVVGSGPGAGAVEPGVPFPSVGAGGAADMQRLQEKRMAAIGDPAFKRETLGDKVIGPLVTDVRDEEHAKKLADSYHEYKAQQEHGGSSDADTSATEGSSATGEGLKDAAASARDAAAGTADKAAEGVKDAARGVSEGVQDTAREAADTAKTAGDVAKMEGRSAAEGVKDAAGAAADKAGAAADKAGEKVGSAGDAIKNTAREAVNTAKAGGDVVKMELQSGAEEAKRTVDRVKEGAEGAAERVWHGADEAGQRVRETGDAAAERAGEVVGSAEDAANQAREAAGRAGESAGSTAGSLLASVGDAAKALLGGLMGPFEKEGAFEESSAVVTGPPKDFEPIGVEHLSGPEATAVEASRATGAAAGDTGTAGAAAKSSGELAASASKTPTSGSRGEAAAPAGDTVEIVKGRLQAGVDDTARAAGLAAGHIEGSVEGLLGQVEAASEQVREKVAQVAKDWEVPPAEVPSNTEDIIRSRQQQQ